MKRSKKLLDYVDFSDKKLAKSVNKLNKEELKKIKENKIKTRLKLSNKFENKKD